MTDFSEKAGSAKMAFSRRGILKSGTSLLGCTLAGSTLGALSRQAFAAAAKPTSLNMLYATSEADSDAIKAALPDFKAAMGFDINLDTMPYNGGVKVTEARRLQCDGHLGSGDLCHESAPLGQGSSASLLVDLPRNEMTLLIELVVHLGMN
jgi:hypothetical protein